MPYLKSLSNRKKNLLTFAIGFVVGVAVFWGAMWLMMQADSSTDYEALVYGLVMLTGAPLFPLFLLLDKIGVNINEIWYSIVGCGLIFGFFFVLFRWSFLQIKSPNK